MKHNFKNEIFSTTKNINQTKKNLKSYIFFNLNQNIPKNITTKAEIE